MAGVALDQIAFVIRWEMPGTERNGLINSHIVPDDRRLADYYAGPMIDEKPRADARPGMNVDASPGMGNLGDQAGNQSCTQTMQNVRHAMMDDRCHSGIADQDFRKIPCRGIANECRPQVANEKSAYLGQL